jgi:transcription antitermination factor NusG
MSAFGQAISPDSCWFAVQVKARQEARLAEALRQKGYELFLPVRCGEERTSARRRPLFPGYVFCRLDPKYRLPVLTTPGVIGFAGTGRLPVPIPEDEIERIRIMVASGLAREAIPLVSAGERIRVIEGALRGLEGILVREKNQWRVVVSISLLQRSVVADVHREWVEPAAQSPDAA